MTAPAMTMQADEEDAPVEPNEGLIFEQDEEEADDEMMEKRKRAIDILYGDSCPLAMEDPTGDDWVSWMSGLWDDRAPYMMPILYEVERNRLFADGMQWISSTNKGPWREPPKPKDKLRLVVNMIGPALDWRLQVLTEQRPGVKAIPASTDPDDQKRAQANQLLLDYQHTQQDVPAILREACFWAQRDGVSFVRQYWEPDRGIEDEVYGGTLGDVAPRHYRIEQVRVSPNATATEEPIWWVLKETLTTAEAVRTYGEDVVDESTRSGSDNTGVRSTPQSRDTDIYRGSRQGGNDFDTVDRFTVILPPNKNFLPKGLEAVCVGTKLISAGPIPGGVTPIWRVTDGSSDPAFFPKPQMTQWISDQMTLNAVYSMFVENVRRNTGGRYIAASGRVVSETLRGGQDSIVEVRSPGDIGQVMQQVQGFSVGNDAKELIQALVKRLEDATGFNDTARGSMTAEASGRAILAVREQLERSFAPAVWAAARAIREWGKITLALCSWGYEVPRMIAAVGRARPDLGRTIQSEDIDPSTDVYLDPQTMMPTPYSIRLYQLDDFYAKGMISAEEYRKRVGFAFTNDLATPDSVQEARAMRVVEQMRMQGQVEPMLWQDDEAIHQDVLERELILTADVDPMVLQMAQARWAELANQQMMKQGGMPPQAGGPAGPGAPAGNLDGIDLPPEVAPTMAMPSSIATAPMMQEQTVQSQAAKLFEQTAPQ